MRLSSRPLPTKSNDSTSQNSILSKRHLFLNHPNPSSPFLRSKLELRRLLCLRIGRWRHVFFLPLLFFPEPFSLGFDLFGYRFTYFYVRFNKFEIIVIG